MIVVIAVDKPHFGPKPNEDVGEVIERVFARPQMPPIAQLDHFGVVLAGAKGGALDE